MRKIYISVGYISFCIFSCCCINAQLTFTELLEQAEEHSTELVSLKASREILILESAKIRAENTSPKAYVSSELLFAPYLNNNGAVVSTDPQITAIGYDVGITNGGLYAFLLNAELPILNHGQVNNLLEQNHLEITTIPVVGFLFADVSLQGMRVYQHPKTQPNFYLKHHLLFR